MFANLYCMHSGLLAPIYLEAGKLIVSTSIIPFKSDMCMEMYLQGCCHRIRCQTMALARTGILLHHCQKPEAQDPQPCYIKKNEYKKKRKENIKNKIKRGGNSIIKQNS